MNLRIKNKMDRMKSFYFLIKDFKLNYRIEKKFKKIQIDFDYLYNIYFLFSKLLYLKENNFKKVLI